MSKQIKVSDEVHQRLMGAKKDTETVSDLISRLLDCKPAQTDEADKLLEQLDKKSEEIPMEEINDEEWVMGVAPECCCDFVAHEFNPQYKCEHWHKVKWTDRNGQQKINWHNKLINKFDFANEWKLAMQEYFD